MSYIHASALHTKIQKEESNWFRDCLTKLDPKATRTTIIWATKRSLLKVYYYKLGLILTPLEPYFVSSRRCDEIINIFLRLKNLLQTAERRKRVKLAKNPRASIMYV